MKIWEPIQNKLSRFIPKHVYDPIGLLKRMISSRKYAALFTLWLTGLGILFIPVNWLCQFIESHTSASFSTKRHGPHIFICGPARSGTTLVYQVLADTLTVTYPRNFTILFSKAPIFASRLFSRRKNAAPGSDYENYFGKTAGMQAPSEANHLWSQWVDPDISGYRTKLLDSGAIAVARFFQQLSALSETPTLSKNNNINAFADVIAEHLDNSYFICMRRDTRYLAQSLLQARLEINGDLSQSYGVTDNDTQSSTSDPYIQVTRQIDYLNDLALTQQRKIGRDRFWIVDYEAFCNNPTNLINRIKLQILEQGETDLLDPETVPVIECNNKITDSQLFSEVELCLAQQSAINLQNSAV